MSLKFPLAARSSDEQKRAEADVERFREQLGPFVAAAEATRMPMLFTECAAGDHRIVFVNNSFLSLTGYARGELLGQRFGSLLAPDVDPELMAKVKADFADDMTRARPTFDSVVELQFRRKDGGDFWATVFISPVRDSSGKLMQHFISVHDQSKHRQEQAQCEMLIAELNHRVKNTLSTVQAIVAQSLRSSSDPAVINESIQSRVFALARSHDLLTEVDWKDTGLRDLVKRSLEPFVENGRARRLVISGEDVRLPPKTTLALGIALHELAMNAVKFGAFMNGTGLVTIDWKIERQSDANRLILCWRETDGPPVTSPSRKGFGSQVLGRGLGHELHGTVHVDYPPGGVVCTIDIPAPRVAHVK